MSVKEKKKRAIAQVEVTAHVKRTPHENKVQVMPLGVTLIPTRKRTRRDRNDARS
jgi:hypothetical protein